jgi:FPC/CPF motif-containing protein YcgG
MTSSYLDNAQAREMLPPGSWQKVVFAEFESQMNSEVRPFPCTFGVNGYRLNQLRYLFLDPFDVATLAEGLARYVGEARSFGPNTSLVVFTRPGPVRSLEAYYNQFWTTLDQLARIDDADWPAEIPHSVDHPMWEFCFAGEPIFVVCNTPAHVSRQSRRSSSFMMTFQPRWVFDKILGSERAAEISFSKVRKRLIPYDSVAPSPHLGRYGNPEGREFRQYFLLDDNETKMTCPFHRLSHGKTATADEMEAA